MNKSMNYYLSRIKYMIKYEFWNMFFYVWSQLESKIVDCVSNILGKRLSFNDIIDRPHIHLYAGDLVYTPHYSKELIGLVLHTGNMRSIQHDITMHYPLPDNCVDSYQTEDVLEHIEIDKIPEILEEIYRILKKGGYLRISVPDYRNKQISSRCLYESGRIVYDPCGGQYENHRVIGGGHVWFPIYEDLKEIIDNSSFGKHYEFFHYIDCEQNQIRRKIDYSLGYIQRTPDHIRGDGASSIVVDCYKDE